MRSCIGKPWALATACVLVAATLHADPASLPGALPGAVRDAADGHGKAERFAVDPGLVVGLLRVPVDGSVRVIEWPITPGFRGPVVVTRRDVYAADARIVAVDQGKEIEVPRSELVFFWGSAEGDGSVTIVLWVDPRHGVLGGATHASEGAYDLKPTDQAGTYDLLASGSGGAGFACGNEGLHTPSRLGSRHPNRTVSASPNLISTLHSTVIAIDTDNEFMGKFGDNVTNATNYVAQLFAGLSAIFERDLFIRPQQGYTVLRLTTTADPYVANAGGSADAAKLNEASAYWNARYGGIKRSLVAFLSGKQPGPVTSGSGIAFLGTLCDGYYGMSFNQVARAGGTADFWEFFLLSHEIGHNMGAPHTHCTDTDSVAAGIQPIDFCYASDCGASWIPNPGAFCPAPFTVTPANGAPVGGVRGTIMSYCHIFGGCPVTNVFHPQSISLAMSPEIDAAVGQCIFPVATPPNPAPTVSGISPTTGSSNGGRLVTITGTNFRSPATVAFGDLSAGAQAAGVVVVDSATITALTPARSAGITDVVVMNPDQQTGTLRSAYNYFQGPSITSISPNAGSAAGGTPLTITGSVFGTPATLSLGGTPATAVTVVNSTTITATTAAHAAGIVDVTLSVPVETITLGAAYHYFTPAPPGRLYTLTPCRLVDTRLPFGGLGGPALVAGAIRTFTLADVCGVPADARALSLNVTVTTPASSGFLTLFPGDSIPPYTSTINFAVSQTRANNTVAFLATNGTGTLRVLNGSTAFVHLILDVTGYFR